MKRLIYATDLVFDHNKHDIRISNGLLRYSVQYVGDNPTSICVHGIEVDPECRGEGIGTKLLSVIQALSDKYDLPVELFATPIRNSNMSEDELIQWYLRHGFSKVAGSNHELVYTPN